MLKLLRQKFVAAKNIASFLFVKNSFAASDLKYFPAVSPQSSRPVVCIFSYTPVSGEPRVLRQAAAMQEAGWQPLVFGCEGRSHHPEQWHFCAVPAGTPYPKVIVLLLRLTQLFGVALAKWAPLGSVRSWGSRIYFGAQPLGRWRTRLAEDFVRNNPTLRPKLVISHDYFTCPPGYGVACATGAKFVVDCHEYARGQYMHDPKWVRYMRPVITHCQDFYLAKADAVTTVCAGIADLLDKEQVLKRPVTVVRSVPFRNIQPFRPTGERINVIYLGEIHYIRGLHKAIKSMPLWRPEFHLMLQGNGSESYIDSLNRLAREHGVADRVHVRDPVPFHEIVPSANTADIGYFVHKDLSPQKRFVLPNKFFEYVMAGLALCVSDLPEMARLVQQYDLGRLVPDYDEEAIAAVINSFDRASIDAYKKNAIAAAAELNWDAEKKRMLSLYESVLK